ncbi:class I SAM-dependent methyltransferase [Candidatus Roizmanbacteria bacterium]|nr:class I SAM-dependent methyltransferase [Candidatus Roizmanbacteria bacterium]
MFFFILGTFFITLIIVLLLFSSKRLSPVPYFPTNKKDLPLIIKTLGLKNNQIVFDLGAGDGLVLFKAAQESFKKKLSTKFVAVEINPVLILILHLRRLFHVNKENVRIVMGDFFKINFKRFTFQVIRSTFYLYISPWFLDTVAKRVKSEVPDAKIVSYMYPVKSLRKKEKIVVGVNKLFLYEV